MFLTLSSAVDLICCVVYYKTLFRLVCDHINEGMSINILGLLRVLSIMYIQLSLCRKYSSEVKPSKQFTGTFLSIQPKTSTISDVSLRFKNKAIWYSMIMQFPDNLS